MNEKEQNKNSKDSKHKLKLNRTSYLKGCKIEISYDSEINKNVIYFNDQLVDNEVIDCLFERAIEARKANLSLA
jgi:hypothetical protein